MLGRMSIFYYLRNRNKRIETSVKQQFILAEQMPVSTKTEATSPTGQGAGARSARYSWQDVALGLIAWLCALGVGAQNYMFKQLDMRDGLPHNQVNVIHKDSRGFVWFGTASGLARYDGYTFKTFRSKYGDKSSIPGNYVDQITEDSDGQLWVRTDDNEYSLYDPATETFNQDVRAWMWAIGIDGVPQDLYIGPDKTRWLYVSGKGLYRHRPGESHATALAVGEGGLPSRQISSMTTCSEGLLLAYDDGCLICVDHERMSVRWELTNITESLADERFDTFRLFVDDDEDLWVYGALGTWVYSLREKHWRPELTSSIDAPPINMVNAIVQASDGTIWLGKNQGGIDLLDKRTGRRHQLAYRSDLEQGLTANTINALFEDDNGIIWIGTYKKGVAYYSESLYKFAFHTVDDINCIEEDPGRGLWLGTNADGLIHWNPHTGERHTYVHRGENSPSTDAVVCLLRAHDGRLWMGTFWGGLDCWDGTRFTHYRHRSGEANALANNNVWSLAEDKRGCIWIGTLGGGVQRLNPATGEFKTYNMASSGLISDHIASICVTHDDRLIIGTASCGIAILDLKTERITNLVGNLSGETHFSNQSINQVYEDSQGLIWVGTRNGLNLYNPRTDRLQVIAMPEVSGSEFIAGIVEDEGKTLWVTTATGVVSIVPYISGKAGNYAFDIHTYSSFDGVQSCGFNQRSIKRLTTGEIVMGGMYGVNTLHPDNMKYNQIRPRVMFTGFALFNEEVVPGQKYGGRVILPEALDYVREVELNYEQNVFSVIFASDNYILPEKTTYAYRLEGFDNDYLTTGADLHRVTYTNLSPGTYRLRVRAINNDGYAGTEEATMRIIILPPFWLTPWAYAVYAVLFVGALCLVYLFIQHRERNRFRLQQMEQEARQAEEINQMKFRFFTNVSHELRTPLTLIISPLEEMMKATVDPQQQTRLKMMHRNASRLLNLVNQLLDFRKSEMAGLQLNLSEGDAVTFVRTVCDSFLALSEKKNVHLTFFSAEESLYFRFDEDKLGKIVTNLLGNAFKFTPEGGRVDVALEHVHNGQEALIIRVSDTGIGISDADKERIFDRFYQVEGRQQTHNATGSGIGLSLVREFVNLHGGTVRVLDNVETGSVFVVSIPIRRTEQAESETGKGTEPVAADSQTALESATTSPSLPSPTDERSPEEKQKPLALVVDDNADLVAFVQDSLSLYFRICSADNGQKAWQMLTDGRMKPDIVICDVMMPQMDGNELCRLIKAEKATAHIPVILLSAKQRTEDRLQGLKAGADDYVTKPFNVEILMLRMRKLIDLSRQGKPRTQIDPEPSEIVITSLDEQLVENAIKYVEQNISRTDLSVEELSAAMGMSRVPLYKKLLRITGKTPIEFIRIIRLKRAAQLLRESQLNVSEIAFQLGFSSPKYFTKYFKDEFGLTPSAYQEAKGKKQINPLSKTSPAPP